MSAVPRHRAEPSTTVPERRRPAAPRPGLTVVPGSRHSRTRAAKRARWTSRFAVTFRSNPARVSIGLLVVSGVVFGLVLLNIHVAQTSFHLSDLQRQAAELQTEQRRLRYEVARAESPERVVEMGTALGLVAPADQVYLEGPEPAVAGAAAAGGTQEEPPR
jgi:cell division protein FtsL